MSYDPLPDPNFQPTEADDVVFLPNDKQIIRNEDRYHEEVKISDVLANRRSLGDIAAQAQAAETGKGLLCCVISGNIADFFTSADAFVDAKKE